MSSTVERPRHRMLVEDSWLAEHRLTPGVSQFIEEPALFGMPYFGRSPKLAQRAERIIKGPVLWPDDRPGAVIRSDAADHYAAGSASRELEVKIRVGDPSY